MKKFWKYYFPLLFWAGFIFYHSAQPHLKMPKFEFVHFDKIAHFTVYLILGILLTRSLCSGDKQKLVWRIFIWAIVLGGLYGASDEFHQKFVPGRSVDLADWIADVSGVIAAQAFVVYLSRRFQRLFRYIF